MFNRVRKVKNGRRRIGAVSVEFAMVAPLFFTIVISSIEFASVHMLQCTVENACFEGARRGMVPGATSSDCRKTAETLLAAGFVRDFVLEVTPSTIDAAAESVVVRASVPITGENSFGFGLSGFFLGKSIMKEVSLPRQRR